MIGEFQPFLNISFRLSERSAVGCKFFGCHLAYKTNNFAKVNKKNATFSKKILSFPTKHSTAFREGQKI